MAVEDYMCTREAAEAWGLSMAGVLRLCNLQRIPGAGKVGHGWIIPRAAQRPEDRRRLTGKRCEKKTGKRKQQHNRRVHR